MSRLFVKGSSVGDEVVVLSDDPLSLKAAYDRHGSLIYTYCNRRLGSEQAKDATQEVFLSAWNARASFDAERGNLAAWLMGIAKNRVVDALRAERRHADRRAAETDLPDSTSDDPDRVADRILVADGLERLPERARRVIELAYIGGYSHQQITDETGIPIGTVKSDIRRGLDSLRQHLGVQP